MNHTKEPCPYCDGDGLKLPRTGEYLEVRVLAVETSWMWRILIQDANYKHEVPIHYCPMCGRKLEDV